MTGEKPFEGHEPPQESAEKRLSQGGEPLQTSSETSGLREKVTIKVAQVLEKENRTSNFKESDFELITQHTESRELTPDDWEAVGELYQKSEMSTEVFQHLANKDYISAEQEAAKGGMIDKWISNPRELQALRNRNPAYISSGEEMLRFLKREYKPESSEAGKGRVADFRMWGQFDRDKKLRSAAAAFLPPKDSDLLERHTEQIQKLFTGQYTYDRHGIQFYPSGKNSFSYADEHQKRAPTTAEFYLILQDVKGSGAFIIQKMLQDLKDEEMQITDWYLLRFGALKVLEPEEDTRLANSLENDASKRFFKHRGFRDVGVFSYKDQIAAREVGSSVVIVEPEWKVMWSSNDEFASGNATEVAEIYRKAEEHKPRRARS